MPVLLLMTLDRTSGLVWVQGAQKTRNQRRMVPKSLKFFQTLSSFLSSPFKILLSYVHISQNSRSFQNLLTRFGMASGLCKGSESESQECEIGSCQQADRLSAHFSGRGQDTQQSPSLSSVLCLLGETTAEVQMVPKW